jgi:hypothetical protein
MEATSSRDAESARESQSGDVGDNETASANSRHLKVVATTALDWISYDFGPSTITKTHLGTMESYSQYFPKGYGRPPGAESVPEPRVNEAVVFEDVFAARPHMPPHLGLVDILRKFRVQLHQLTPNTIIQISKFI